MFRTGFLSIIRTLVPYDIHLLLCIRYKTPDDGQETCLKHVEFYSKNKFEKLVRLVCFVIRIYHDARSSECEYRAYSLITIIFSYQSLSTRFYLSCQDTEQSVSHNLKFKIPHNQAVLNK